MNVADMFEEFGVDSCKIELTDYCKCETTEELLKREGECIKKTVNASIGHSFAKKIKEECVPKATHTTTHISRKG